MVLQLNRFKISFNSTAVNFSNLIFLERYLCSLPHYLTCNLTQSKPFPINSKVAKLTICFQRKLFAFHKQRNQFSGCFYIMTARLVRKWKIQTINQLFHIQNTKHLVLLTFFLTDLIETAGLIVLCKYSLREGKLRRKKSWLYCRLFKNLRFRDFEATVSALWTDCLVLFS